MDSKRKSGIFMLKKHIRYQLCLSLESKLFIKIKNSTKSRKLIKEFQELYQFSLREEGLSFDSCNLYKGLKGIIIFLFSRIQRYHFTSYYLFLYSISFRKF